MGARAQVPLRAIVAAAVIAAGLAGLSAPALAVAPDGPITVGGRTYILTCSTYPGSADWDAAVVEEFGVGAVVPDFNDLQTLRDADFTAFYDWLRDGAALSVAAFVELDGQKNNVSDASRQYFIQAHSFLPGGFSVHAYVNGTSSGDGSGSGVPYPRVNVGSWRDPFHILADVTALATTPTASCTPRIGPETQTVGGAAGQELTATSPLTASSFAGTVTYAVTSGSLPEGLTLDTTTGVVSGTPTTAGTSTVTITGTGSTSGSATATISFTVTADVPELTPERQTVGGTIGQAMVPTSPITPSDFVGTVTYAVTSGSLPEGLALDAATGVVSGTPTAIGTSTITITGTGSTWGTATATISFDVAPPSSTPSGPSYVAPGGVVPSVSVEVGQWVQPDGSSLPLTVSTPASNQVRYSGDGIQVTFTGAPGSSAANGLVADANGMVECEVCARLAAGEVIEAWMFSTSRLVAAHRIEDLPCQRFLIPVGAPLDGGGPVTAGVHTLQLALPTPSGMEAVNVGVTVGAPMPTPTTVPTGGGPVPVVPAQSMLVAALAGVLVTLSARVRTTAAVTAEQAALRTRAALRIRSATRLQAFDDLERRIAEFRARLRS